MSGSICRVACVRQLITIIDPNASVSQVVAEPVVLILVELCIGNFVSELVSWYSVKSLADIECDEPCAMGWFDLLTITVYVRLVSSVDVECSDLNAWFVLDS